MTSPTRADQGGIVFEAWRHRWAALTVGATLVLVFIGGLVTSTGSGLAVPDWPLSYGMLMPPMVGGIFYEHGHRMAATAVGLLTVVLAVWTARKEARPGVRRLAWAALLAVIAQGVLGGLTVLLLLPPSVSIAHACLAQTFLCLAVALFASTSRDWLAAGPPRPDAASLRPAALLTAGLVYVQLFVGAVMRHLGAGLAIPDFPLAFGGLVPPLNSTPVAVHFLHRLGALLVLVSTLVLLRRALLSGESRFRRPAVMLAVLVVVQISLGGLTVLSGRAVLPTTLHVAVGAAVLGTAFLILLRAWRHLLALRRHTVPAAVALPDGARS